ncbi:GGDEF domain-containing protein [Nakamurella deserti]|uniref:GGDEF domain-containing protein n=1 Tax=Nakamurella deserti TaxID=2164074 RepID=UPI000DBE5B00|nr:GGDEF domain-containing protein [Nakamurella deserti]
MTSTLAPLAPSVSTPAVPAGLQPARAFDSACAMVVDYLMDAVPLGMWAVTRVTHGRQIMLEVRGSDYPVRAGLEIPFEASLCEPMATGRAPQIAPDVSAVRAYDVLEKALPMSIGAYVGTPIVMPDGALFGTVCGFATTAQDDSMLRLQPLLGLLSSLLSSVLDADTSVTAAARALERTRIEAETDALTGLVNRRGWDRFLEEEEDRFKRFADPACVIVMDLDRLKYVNDTFGHHEGDRYIQRAATAMASTVRQGDVLARLGGDEFGVVMIGASPDQAGKLVDRMAAALQEAGVSCSFGAAPYTVVAGFPGAWRAADEAMYEAKRINRTGQLPR